MSERVVFVTLLIKSRLEQITSAPFKLRIDLPVGEMRKIRHQVVTQVITYA